MKPIRLVLLAAALVPLGLRIAPPARSVPAGPPPTLAGQPAGAAVARGVAARIDRPLAFAPNQGQAPDDVLFATRGRGFDLRLDAGGARLALEDGSAAKTLRLRFAGASTAPRVTAETPLPGRMHYLYGRDASRWIRDVPTFARVRYAGMYPGVDVVYYGNQQRLEYDLVVAPTADPGRVRLAFDGADRVALDAAGALRVYVGDRYLEEQAPRLYQERNGTRTAVGGRYRIVGKTEVGIDVDAYDHERPLVIDPLVLGWSTYLGGEADDWIDAAAVNSKGELVVAGTTGSDMWPFSRQAGLFSPGGGKDVFVSRFAADGTHLSTTLLGGESDDRATAIAIDAQDNIYLTGSTQSLQFPTTANAVLPHSESLQVTFGIGPIKFPSIDTAQANDSDAFMTRLDSSGKSVVYSTYLGGSPQVAATLKQKELNAKKLEIKFEANPGLDYGTGIAVDGKGNAYVVGATDSTAFPVTDDAIKSDLNGFLDSPDGFIVKIDTNGSGTGSMKFSSYLGGSCQDEATGVATDGQGHVYVTGDTKSPVICGGFTTTTGGGYIGGDQDAWAMGLILDPALNPTPGVFFSRFLGTTNQDWGGHIGVDPHGDIYASYVEASSSTNGTLHVVKLSRDGTQQLWDQSLGQTTGGSFSGWTPPTLFQSTFFPHGLFVTPYSLATGVFAVRNESGTSASYLDQFSDLASGAHVETNLGLGGRNFVSAVTADADKVYIAGGTSVDTLATQAAAQPQRNGGMDGFAASFTYNLPPVVTGGAFSAGREGDTFSGVVASYVDQTTVPGVYTGTIDWGDGTSDTGIADNVEAADGQVAGRHTYADFGTYSGRACLTRTSDNQVTCAGFTATVADFPPTVAPINASVGPGTLGAVYAPVVGSAGAQVQVSLSQIATFVDHGVHDVHTASIEWGDGSTTAVPVVEGERRLGTASHTYASGSLAGNANATVCVTDRAGMKDCQPFTIQIPFTDLQVSLNGPATADECAVPGYSLTVANRGPVDATNVTVTARLSDRANAAFDATTLLGAGGGASTSSFLTTLPTSNSTELGAAAAISGNDAVAEGWGQQPQVFHFDTNRLQWTQVATLPWEADKPNLASVTALAISGDTIVRGWFGDGSIDGERGRAVVYSRAGGTWSPTQTLIPGDLTDTNDFGLAVALRGSVMAVGAPCGSRGNCGDGAIYVFRRGADGQWTQSQKIVPVIPSQDPGDETSKRFGYAVALTPDGRTLFVGAPLDTQVNLDDYLHPENGANGAVWVYQLSDDGAYTFKTRLFSSHPSANFREGFGHALSADAGVLVVGSPDEDNGGAVYVFTLAGDGGWTQAAYLTPPNPEFQFGQNVAVSGSQALVWASNNSVYVTQQSGETWRSVSKLTTPADGPSFFGMSLAIDHGRFLIGAPGSQFSSPLNTNSGAVYAFSGCQQTEPGVLTCNVGSLGAGDSLTFGVNVSLGSKIVDAPVSPATGSVSIDASVGGGILDSSLGNNTASASTSVMNTATVCNDTTPPIVTPKITGTQGQNLWYTSNVTVDWLVADPESAYTTAGCDSTATTQDTSGQSATCTATSSGGTASGTTTVRVDTTPPTITPLVSLAPGGRSFAVSFACSDAGSGVASCPAEASMAPGSSAVFASTDVAGNTAPVTVDLPFVSAGGPLVFTPPAGACAAGVTLQGSGIDSTGGALTFVWTENGLPIATGATPTVTLSAGLHHLVLTGTTASGISMTDTTDVTVTAPLVTLTGAADQIVVDATGVLTPVDVPQPVAAGCGVTMTSNEPPDSRFLAGRSTVLFTAVDAFGRTATQATSVLVRPHVDAGITIPAATITAGSPSPYTFTVSNAGPSTASEIDVLQQLPAGLVPVATTTKDPTTNEDEQVCVANGDGQTCVPIPTLSNDAACVITPSGAVKCSLFDVAPDETRTVHLSLAATASFPTGDDSVSASLTTIEPDGNSVNDTATGTLTVVRSTDLELSFEAPPPTAAAAGGSVGFVLHVTNHGLSDSAGFSVVSALGGELSFQSGTDGCVGSAGALACTSGPLAVGEGRSIAVTLHVDPSARGTVAFLAAVHSLDALDVDPIRGNNAVSTSAAVVPLVTSSVAFAEGPASLIAGGSAPLTVLLSETDPFGSDALGASATVHLTSGATVTTAPGCQIAPGGDSFTCTIAKIPASGEPVALPFTVAVDPFARGTVTATATLQTVEESTSHVAQTPPIPILVAVQPTLSVQASPSAAVAGLPLTYMITAANRGPSGATNVRLDASVPADTTLTSASALYFSGSSSTGVPVTCAGTTAIECMVTQLAPTDRVVVTLKVAVASDALAHATRLGGGVTLFSSESASPTAASLAVNLTASAGIHLTSLVPQTSPAVAGTPLILTASVTNDGPSDATNVQVTVPLPADRSWTPPETADQSDDCVADHSAITCSLGALKAGDHTTHNFAVAIDPFWRKSIVVGARASAAETDPDSSDNHASATVATTAQATLGLDLSATPSPAVAGQSLSYTLRISNLGPSGATGVSAEVTLPAGTTAGDLPAGCTPSGQLVSCTVEASIAPQDAHALNVPADVDQFARGTDGEIVASASAQARETTSAATATRSTPIDARADVRVSVEAEPNPLVAGNFLTYAITVTNDGPSGAIGATLTHALPSGVMFASAAGPSATCDHANGLITCTLPNIGHGASTTVDVAAVPPVAGTLVATSTVHVVEDDPDLSNNTVDSTTMVSSPSSGRAGLGDFNGDGALDLAVSDPRHDVVHIYLNDGHGGFVETEQVPVGKRPNGLAVGDLDNDGRVEIVVADQGSDALSILANDGLGLFHESARVPTLGDEPAQVALGDLDGDGRLDIATTNYQSDTVSVLIAGAGGEWAVQQLGVGAGHGKHHPLTIAVADLNRDGTLDIVVGNKTPDSVALLFNRGQAQFAPPQEMALASTDDPSGFAIADFDNDGDLDIAVVGKDRGVFALLGNTGGVFAESAVSGPMEDRPVAITAGDLDGDGNVDLVVAAGDDAATLLNAGGTFPAALAVNLEAAPKKAIALMAGDVDGDGVLDLVVIDDQVHVSVLISARGPVEPKHRH